MAVNQLPYYTISADALAEWIEGQKDSWWFVDGDPILTSRIDFPCPADELAPAIREIDKELLVRDNSPNSHATGQKVACDQLDGLSDQSDRRHQKTLRLSWANSNIDWLLIQDKDVPVVS